ncbi:hypothetical protein [Nostoc sp.]|uniref:hypothetical protein n=1 Tax=Nostoc sp. TaxID=1180 RepID=UPI003FA53924
MLNHKQICRRTAACRQTSLGHVILNNNALAAQIKLSVAELAEIDTILITVKLCGIGDNTDC